MNVISVRNGPCMIPVGFNCRSNVVCLRSKPRNDGIRVLRRGGGIYVAFDLKRGLICRRRGITYDCDVHSRDTVYHKGMRFIRSVRRGHNTLSVVVYRCAGGRFGCSSPTIHGIGM